MRGLKLTLITSVNKVRKVAPYVGAWIETYIRRYYYKAPNVAPYVGAWIETCYRLRIEQFLLSHPTWVRGLNLKIKEQKRLVSLHHQGCYTYDVYQHVYLQIYEG